MPLGVLVVMQRVETTPEYIKNHVILGETASEKLAGREMCEK